MKSRILINSLTSAAILTVSFALSLAIQNLFRTQSLIPAVFVLAVFCISLVTQGYIAGILSSLCIYFSIFQI